MTANEAREIRSKALAAEEEGYGPIVLEVMESIGQAASLGWNRLQFPDRRRPYNLDVELVGAVRVHLLAAGYVVSEVERTPLGVNFTISW